MRDRNNSRMPIREVSARMFGMLLVVSIALSCMGQAQKRIQHAVVNNRPAEMLVTSHASAPALTAADAEAFLDGLVPHQLQREDIAGAVVVVVKDGRLLFAKGYGYADVAKQAPVSAETTLFRPGSISKLFTWTAVLQLWEQGKLDLDRDVNGYLDFKIPAKFGKPITLRNLMTHRSGFQESVKDLYISAPGQMEPLGEYVKSHIPDQIYPPGEVPAYSNYGACLAGYIVERITGHSFEQYVEDHIFRPLAMHYASFRQPLPESLSPFMSKGYKLASKPPRPFELNEGPQGGLAVSGADMVPFMIAQLQSGEFNGVRILKPETVALMQGRQLAYNPALDWMCLGFYEEGQNGHRIISHAGGSTLFFSDLHLMPDQGLGFFVSYNSAGKGQISAQSVLWREFLDRYYPYEPPAPQSIADKTGDANSVAGYYESTRGFQTNFLKLLSVVTQLKVLPQPDGTLQIDPIKNPNGQLKRWEEIGPLLYRETGGPARIGFQRDATGRMVLSYGYPVFVFRHVSGLQTRAASLLVFVGAGIVFLLTLIIWAVSALVRRHYKRVLALTPQQLRRRTLTRIACAVSFLFLIAIPLFVLLAIGDGMPTTRQDPWIRIIQLLGLLSLVGTVFILVETARTWIENGRGIWVKLGTSLIAVSSIGLAWFILAFHFLRWSLNY